MSIVKAYRNAPKEFVFDYCEKVIEFFDQKPYGEKIITGMRGKIDIKLIPCNPPLFERFASELGVPSRKVIQWREDFEEFDEACEIAQDLQEYIIVTNSLLGLYEKTFSKLLVKNKLGWKETVEQDINNKVSIEGLIGRIAHSNKDSDFMEQKDASLRLITNAS